MRDLGTMGESTFSLLCADAGMTANGSKIDKMSWDFIVEMPASANVSAALLHQSPVSMKVQVKATDGNSRKVDVKLSNLRLMVTSLQPNFFCFIEFDSETHAKQVFIRHVDNELVTMTLKRIREIDQNEDDNALNKRTMSISFDDANLLQNCDGVTLKNTLMSHIGDNIADYTLSKQKYLESTGYEDGSFNIRFQTDDIQAFTNMSLGIVSQVPVKNVKQTDLRFGIESEAIDPLPINANITFCPEPRKGKIIFSFDKISPKIDFDIKLYRAIEYKGMHDGSTRSRIAGDLFEIFFTRKEKGIKFNTNIDIQKSIPLDELIKYLSFLEKMQCADEISVELSFDEDEEFDGSFIMNSNKKEFPFCKILRVLNIASKLLHNFKVLNQVNITLEQLTQDQDEILKFDRILSASPQLITINNLNLSKVKEMEAKIANIILIKTFIGDLALGAFMVLTGQTKKVEGSDDEWESTDFIVEERIIIKRDENLSSKDINPIVEKIANKYYGDFTVTTEIELD